jgi:hypothetical protein
VRGQRLGPGWRIHRGRCPGLDGKALEGEPPAAVVFRRHTPNAGHVSSGTRQRDELVDFGSDRRRIHLPGSPCLRRPRRAYSRPRGPRHCTCDQYVGRSRRPSRCPSRGRVRRNGCRRDDPSRTGPSTAPDRNCTPLDSGSPVNYAPPAYRTSRGRRSARQARGSAARPATCGNGLTVIQRQAGSGLTSAAMAGFGC